MHHTLNPEADGQQRTTPASYELETEATIHVGYFLAHFATSHQSSIQCSTLGCGGMEDSHHGICSNCVMLLSQYRPKHPRNVSTVSNYILLNFAFKTSEGKRKSNKVYLTNWPMSL